MRRIVAILFATATVALSAASAQAAAPLLEFLFEDTGTTSTSTGTSAAVVSFQDMTATATDLHGATGSGVTGDIVGHAGFGVDKAFDNTASIAMQNKGGIGINDTDTSFSSGLTSWTVSGWYKTESQPLSGGGTVVFQTPKSFAAGLGFAVRGEGPNGFRTSVNSTNTGAGSSGNVWTDVAKWVYFAVTYDGSQTIGNLHYYRGYRNADEAGTNPVQVTEVAFDTLDKGKVVATTGFSMGNRVDDYSRAFDGFLDNLRVFGSVNDSTGALSLSEIESWRSGDVSTTVPPEGDADFNGDGLVDGEDFLVWQRGFGIGSASEAGDANTDGVVDGVDLEIWKTQFGTAAETPPEGIAAVPEPAAVTLLVTGLAAMSRLPRRVLGIRR